MINLDWIENAITLYAIGVSGAGAAVASSRLRRDWKYRDLRRFWGFKPKGKVLLICSEIPNPTRRQNPEPREFVYMYKYGDLDALMEVVSTIQALYPRVDLRCMSSGEFERSQVNLSGYDIVCVGGPDYNAMTKRVIESGRTRMFYDSQRVVRRFWFGWRSEVILRDRLDPSRRYFEKMDSRDYGYIEKLRNPYSEKGKRIILFGGCRALGVTAAARSVSVLSLADGYSANTVLENAQRLREIPANMRGAVVLVKAQRLNDSVATPRLPGDGEILGG